MAAALVLRVFSPDQGTKRLSVAPSTTTESLYLLIAAEFHLPSDGTWYLSCDRKGLQKVARSRQQLSTLPIRNGDILYLNNSGAAGSTSASVAGGQIGIDSISATSPAPSNLSARVIEDPVDQVLEQASGKIIRPRNEQLCRHGPSGKCIHCVPLEPFDEEYLKQCNPPVKFLSFHSYLRKLNSGVDKGKFVYLENLSCKIKPGCRGHAPWPAGICTKCQPNAVTLARQKFRHVDYITIENRFVMDRFLDSWRKTGNQRMGILIGKYEQLSDVPLGIKAMVCAIYEPPQICTRNSIQFLDDPSAADVDRLCSSLGLRRVGWIFTDLLPLDKKTGTVKYTRGHQDSYFLSAEECIVAADFQNKYPNICRHAAEGVFGSKFVTVVATGDKDNQVHFEGYQVSDQCMGLVRDDCLVPTYDAPELGYIRESTNEQYVPDVFYKEKDKYGNEVTKLARPLPVEYLLIDMAVGFPIDQQFTFTASGNIKPFPVEHRDRMGEVQNLEALADYVKQFSDEDFLSAACDFHFLYFLTQYDMMSFRDHLDPLLEAVLKKDAHLAQTWAHCEHWSTMQHFLQSVSPGGSHSPRNFDPPGGGGAAAAAASSARSLPTHAVPSSSRAGLLPAAGATWSCPHCTFINPVANDKCDICTLPRH